MVRFLETNDGVWDNLLVNKTLSILTAFVNGGQNLPTKADILRIKSNSKKGFSTSLPIKKHRKLSKQAKLMVNNATKSIVSLDQTISQIRMRKNIQESSGTSGWKVELHNTAKRL